MPFPQIPFPNILIYIHLIDALSSTYKELNKSININDKNKFNSK